MRETRAELVAHVGGKPSAVQAAMIERACQLTLRIVAMDRKCVSHRAAPRRACNEHPYHIEIIGESRQTIKKLAQNWLAEKAAWPSRQKLIEIE